MSNLNQLRGLLSIVFILMLDWIGTATVSPFNSDANSVEQSGGFVVAEVDYRGRSPYKRHFQRQNK